MNDHTVNSPLREKLSLNAVGNLDNVVQPRAFARGGKPRKPVKWSHQAELDTLKGRDLDLQLKSGPIDAYGNVEWIRVRLIEADNFALKVSTLFEGSEKQSSLTYFKHDIIAYMAV